MIDLSMLKDVKSYGSTPLFECTLELGELSLNEPGVQLVESQYGKSIRFDTGGKTYYFPVKDGETIQALAERLAIPIEEIKIVFVNGITVELDHPLCDGDRVGVFPPVGGG